MDCGKMEEESFLVEVLVENFAIFPCYVGLTKSNTTTIELIVPLSTRCKREVEPPSKRSFFANSRRRKFADTMNFNPIVEEKVFHGAIGVKLRPGVFNKL